MDVSWSAPLSQPASIWLSHDRVVPFPSGHLSSTGVMHQHHQYRHHTPHSSPEATIISGPARLRAFLVFILVISTALSSPFMAWKGLCILTNSAVPIVCVISDSMAPAFQRGDILFLWNRTTNVQAGEIPVVWFKDSPLPMVHRVIKVINEGDK